MKSNKIKNSFPIILIGIALLSLFILSSCDKAKETVDKASEKVSDVAKKTGDAVKDVTDKAGEAAKNTAEKVGDVAKNVTEKAGNAVDKVADIFSNNGMIGTWTGKLDSRFTTLTVTKQNGNNFEGKIVINYRNQVKQDVKGSFNAETKTIKMEDQLRSRYKGKYNGKLSDDGKTFTGTFTTNVDKKSFNFKLVKK